MNRKLLVRTIDHSILKPDTAESDIKRYCSETVLYGFASLCVMPYYVPFACFTFQEIGFPDIPVGTTIGFPNGSHQSVVKVAEARKALHDGAKELDMVINVSALKSGHRHVVLADIMAVAMVAHEHNALLKVILETALLNDEEKRIACDLASEAGADFVKTCTGFAGGGATIEDIRLMRAASAPHVRIKAAGGIRDYQTAVALIHAGAERIGTSSGVSIISEAPEEDT